MISLKRRIHSDETFDVESCTKNDFNGTLPIKSDLDIWEINYAPNIKELWYRICTTTHGVFQGRPISALLFIIYLDQVIGRYETKLHDKHAIDRPLLAARNEQAAHNWCWIKELARLRAKLERAPRNPIIRESWIAEIPNDTHTYDGDRTVKQPGSAKYIRNFKHSNAKQEFTTFTSTGVKSKLLLANRNTRYTHYGKSPCGISRGWLCQNRGTSRATN